MVFAGPNSMGSAAVCRNTHRRERLGGHRWTVVMHGSGNDGRSRLRLGGPLDPVLDHAAFQGVAGDSKQVGGFDDAASAIKGLRAEKVLCLSQV